MSPMHVSGPASKVRVGLVRPSSHGMPFLTSVAAQPTTKALCLQACTLQSPEAGSVSCLQKRLPQEILTCDSRCGPSTCRLAHCRSDAGLQGQPPQNTSPTKNVDMHFILVAQNSEAALHLAEWILSLPAVLISQNGSRPAVSAACKGMLRFSLLLSTSLLFSKLCMRSTGIVPLLADVCGASPLEQALVLFPVSRHSTETVLLPVDMCGAGLLGQAVPSHRSRHSTDAVLLPVDMCGAGLLGQA
eukprot:1160198-Pelagomonas_calceolata.AAC.1